MLKRGFAIMLGATMLFAASGARAVFAKSGGDAVEEVRTKVARLGVGEKARVEVRLRDEMKFKGFVSRSGDQSFDLTEEKTGVTVEVAYADVTQVKRLGRGGGMSGTTKALIWGGVAASAAVILYAVRGAFCDGMC